MSKVMNFVLVLFLLSAINNNICYSSGVCIGQGQSCLTAPGGCCDGLTCDARYWTCGGASPYPPPPQCQSLNQHCDSYYSCCDGMFCQSGRCVEVEQCIKRGFDCYEGSPSCCSGLRCTGVNGGASSYCLPYTPQPPPKPNCLSQHQYCNSNEQCCYGLTCSQNSGTCESTAPTPSPHCIQQGVNCVASPYACCGGLKCVGFEGEWSCQSNTPPTPPPTPPPSPSCRWKNEYCGQFYGDCCSGLTCTNGGRCESSPNPGPTPLCIQEGLNCVTAPNGCCGGLSCVEGLNGWTCLPATPPQPSPRCQSSNSPCEVGGTPCCSGLKCSYSYIWSRSTTCN